jgi:hypothetical protein
MMGAFGNDTRSPHDAHISAAVTTTQSLIAILNELRSREWQAGCHGCVCKKRWSLLIGPLPMQSEVRISTHQQ